MSSPDFNVDFFNAFSAGTQVQQHFFLGPVNDVVHGRALLVDANSVYGISSAYLIALWFKLVPLNYGTFWLFGGLMSLAYLAVGWGIARAAGASRIFAAGAIVIGRPARHPRGRVPAGRLPEPGRPQVLSAARPGRGRDADLPRRQERFPVAMGPRDARLLLTWSIDGLAYCLGAYIALAMLDALATRSWRQGTVELVKSGLAALAAFIAAHARVRVS